MSSAHDTNPMLLPPTLLVMPPAGSDVCPSAQYLFNVPSGFSRLVLEHQCRPGLGLRAAFVTGPHDAALVRGL